ncbi:MAG: hypothetical protein IJS90_09780 [Clostridia bacterium]|nr:hypothetical protein [Clostridia bacterium]
MKRFLCVFIAFITVFYVSSTALAADGEGEQPTQHTHEYRREFIIVPDCGVDGEVQLVCSCGDVLRTETVPGYEHNWRRRFNFFTGEVTVYCTICGRTYKEVYGEEYTETPYENEEYEQPEECTCVCHDLETNVVPPFDHDSSYVIKSFFYRLRLVIWRLTGTHKYCECGERHY